MYLMSRVDSIKTFYLDQKLLKIIITLFLKGFGKNAFFREVLVTFTVRGICIRHLGTQKFVFHEKFPKGLHQAKEGNEIVPLTCSYSTLYSGQLLKDRTDVKEILHEKDKVYTESFLTHFLIVNTEIHI